MNKKIVTLILVILISFCFLSIVVADNATNDDNNTDDYDETIDEDDGNVNENTIDKKNTTYENKKSDKPKKSYILAKGNGNYITFSDGFRGFILDYSKSPASSGDEFNRVSASKASNSNTLKLAIIECYKQNSVGQIEKIMADFVKTGSSSTKVGESVAASHEIVGNHEIVKINNNTLAVFDFEVLKSVSGNDSDYFAYKVSFITIDDDEYIVLINNITNENDTTAANFDTATPANTTNITNMARPSDNQTNATFFDYLNDYLDYLANGLYDSWKPIIDLLMNGFLMFTNTLEWIVKLFEDIIMTIRSLVDVLEKLLVMLGMIWGTLDGILKILCMIFNVLVQLVNLIGYIFNIIVGLLSTLISLVQQILGLLSGFINFLMDIINQIMSLLQAGFAFLKSSGSSLANVIENALIIITAFVIITIGAFVYDRKSSLISKINIK